MIMAIGEILFDQFPDYRILGGAPFNFCFHLGQFGLPVRFISRVGADLPGSEIIKHLQNLNFPTRDIQIDPEHQTGLVLVQLNRDGVPTYDILPDVAYDHISYEDLVKTPETGTELIYFGSVVQRTDRAHRHLHRFVSAQYPDAKCLFDINLRPNCINQEAVISSLGLCHVLKLNEDELELLKKMKGFNQGDEKFIDCLIDEYSLELLALTRGDKGSVIYSRSPRQKFPAKPTASHHVVDTVGAGDAYTAILAIGYLKKWSNAKTIEAATEFAARICGIQGAVPSSSEIYTDFKKIYF